ncbi:4-(cytidine 5'-diphospho)-2-C-methyl-D-erythritol kinase [Nocardioides panacisoli]|uniref:4-(cytidine 5'-diphospho)-2-C-methyl-D-erythritol kinase n=1 Tax=Nocardioides panacisoli TaxID=627624 RepID=UPI001C624D38|nr:4-(cytidine 5'-diphospho)-2-C-methyl-D-erythritol kinase [Nocardioides panacisoli]QYJ02773.1 4-(cytidine 5'-diphospho)-2-C-methyl-D-erythritol kinase [Nocardioides panacisoli]
MIAGDDATRASVTVRAPAKINLHLGVGALGAGGFHPLATVYQAIGLYEDVTVSDQQDWSVHLTGEADLDLADVPVDESNLAVRAARALCVHHGLTDHAARIEIRKGIPVAGGLAGGSADAAATLLALDRLWDLRTSDEDLLRLGADLGSDVPFALLGGTATGLGRGEEVAPLEDGGDWWWCVVPHAEGLSTPAVYRHFDELSGDGVPPPAVPDELRRALASGDPERLAAQLHNDLQAPALDLRPELRRTFDDGVAAGALAALLSGSGPTVLLLCADQAGVHEVRRAMVEAGHERAVVAPGPVPGVHEVVYENAPDTRNLR